MTAADRVAMARDYGPCATCGDTGAVCCGRYLDTGECCAALNGGAAMEACPDCPPPVERGEAERGR